MSSTPRVSVVMPAYNCACVLPFAIESVLAQTLEDWELILVDDASVDATLPVMQAYARADARIRVLRNERNSRAGPIEWEPRNDGLRVARGALIAYLDADNAWRPHLLERLSSVLLSNDGLQCVYCDSCNHYSEEEARRVAAADPRPLTARGRTWTVFSTGPLDPDRLGVEQYVDTNEIMHRASTFTRLDALWRTRHPHRDAINARQGRRCPYRRHNDLDLVERILAAYGPGSVAHVPEVHVDFYYPSAARLPHPAFQPALLQAGAA